MSWPETLFDGEFEHFPLQLLGTLLHLALSRRQLLAGIVQFLLQLGFLEPSAFLLLRANHRLSMLNLGIDLLLHFARQRRLLVLELFALLAQFELFTPQRRNLGVFVGQLPLERLPFRRHHLRRLGLSRRAHPRFEVLLPGRQGILPTPKRLELAVLFVERLLHLFNSRSHGLLREHSTLGQRSGMRLPLLFERFFKALSFPLCHPRSLAGQLLRPLLDLRPLRVTHRRDRPGTSLRELLQRLFGEPFVETELVCTFWTSNRGVLSKEELPFTKAHPIPYTSGVRVHKVSRLSVLIKTRATG